MDLIIKVVTVSRCWGGPRLQFTRRGGRQTGDRGPWHRQHFKANPEIKAEACSSA